jgi:hypothetical protein
MAHLQEHLQEHLLAQDNPAPHLITVPPLDLLQVNPVQGLPPTDKHQRDTHLQEGLLPVSSLVSMVSNNSASSRVNSQDKPMDSKGRQHPSSMDKLLNTEVLRLSSMVEELGRPIPVTSSTFSKLAFRNRRSQLSTHLVPLSKLLSELHRAVRSIESLPSGGSVKSTHEAVKAD